MSSPTLKADKRLVHAQGLNNAFQVAALIVEALKSVASGAKSLKEAVDAYEEEMIPRASEEVGLSSK